MRIEDTVMDGKVLMDGEKIVATFTKEYAPFAVLFMKFLNYIAKKQMTLEQIEATFGGNDDGTSGDKHA